ncbi:hypothetical protein KR044_004670, partial [Drosophila immigrans]
NSTIMIVAPIHETVKKLLANSRPKHPQINKDVELRVYLKNYDPETDAPLSGPIRLDHMIRNKLKVLVIGDEWHCNEAKANRICFITRPIIDEHFKYRETMKQLPRIFDEFLVSKKIFEKIPSILGPQFTRAGKTPQLLTHKESLMSKIEELKFTTKFKLKKSLKLCAVVGHVRMTPDQLNDNIITSLRFLISLLKNNWANIKSVEIKTEKSQSYSLY